MIDSDKDGVYDMARIDPDKDGRPDAAAFIGPEGHGYTCAIAKWPNAIIEAIDTNNDGKVDKITIDLDGDGNPELVVEDSNFDGSADTFTFDIDSDGRPERVYKNVIEVPAITPPGFLLALLSLLGLAAIAMRKMYKR